MSDTPSPADAPAAAGEVPPAAGPDAAPPAAAAPGPAAPPAAAAPGPSRAEVLLDKGARGAGRGARAVVRELAERRGLRTVLIGIVLTLIALRLGGDSALSAPLLVVGIIMLLAGAMGPRLRGHIGLDFGPEGTAFTMQTHVAPPGRRLAPERDATSAVVPMPPRARIALVPTKPGADGRDAPAVEADAPAPPADADVVESTGETIEIDVAQLRALLAAEERRTTGWGS